jgi:23S rRNA pseudouridine2605 synthase
LIRTGRVSVNGVVVSELGTRADPVRDVIAVDGERLAERRASRTIVLHKPRGVVSTLSDPEGRPTVRDLVAGAGGRLYPVGRLDLQSSGVLLLTDDGALADGLLHPRRGVERVYHVKVHGLPDGRVLGRLRRGVRLDDGLAVPTRVRLLESLPRKAWLEITVREGRSHLVRRMCASLGLPVDKLERVRLGPITLGDLPPGAWRPLTTRELAALRRAARLRRPAGAGEAGKGGRPRGRGTPARTPPPPRGRRSPPGARGAGSAGPPAAPRRVRRPRPAPGGA